MLSQGHHAGLTLITKPSTVVIAKRILELRPLLFWLFVPRQRTTRLTARQSTEHGFGVKSHPLVARVHTWEHSRVNTSFQLSIPLLPQPVRALALSPSSSFINAQTPS
jgi:hypothetical protein